MSIYIKCVLTNDNNSFYFNKVSAPSISLIIRLSFSPSMTF